MLLLLPVLPAVWLSRSGNLLSSFVVIYSHTSRYSPSASARNVRMRRAPLPFVTHPSVSVPRTRGSLRRFVFVADLSSIAVLLFFLTRLSTVIKYYVMLDKEFYAALRQYLANRTIRPQLDQYRRKKVMRVAENFVLKGK